MNIALTIVWMTFAYFVCGLVFYKVMGKVFHKHPSDFFCNGWGKTEHGEPYRCNAYDHDNDTHNWRPSGAFGWLLIWGLVFIVIAVWALFYLPVRSAIWFFTFSSSFLSR